MPGLNDWAFEMLCKHSILKPLQNGMDGTRIIRAVELYQGKYLVSKQFSPDVRLFSAQLVQASTMVDIQQYVPEVRRNNGYSAEAYSYNISDISGEYPDMLVGSIPEAKSGVTGSHIFVQMLEVESRAQQFELPLIGHCTDSAANALKSLAMLATPSTFEGYCIQFIGLPIQQYRYFAPLLHKQ